MSGHINKKEIDEIWSTLNNSKQEVEEGYFGKTLVYESGHYQPGQMVFESTTAGNNTFSVLDNGYYRITVTGAGGGGEWCLITFMNGYFVRGSGGSGGGFQAVYKLKKKTNYSVYLGARGSGGVNGYLHEATDGQNSVFRTFTAYGGTHGNAWVSNASAGLGGSSSTYTTDELLVDVLWNKAGNNGNRSSGISFSQSIAGGASIYRDFGRGANSGHNDGVNGGIEVIYLGKRYNP